MKPALMLSALALLALTEPALTKPALAQPVSTAAQPADLIVKAGAVRYGLANGVDALTMLDGSSRQLFITHLGLNDPDAEALWALTLSGAVQMRRESGDQADTLWYNPLFDGGLIVHWVRGPQGWTATRLAPVLGESLRGEDERIAPHRTAWARKGGSMSDALATSAQTTFAAAEKRDWASLYQAPSDRDVEVMSRPYEGNRAVAEMLNTKGYAASLDIVRHLFIEDDPVARRLPVALAQGLEAYGDTARLGLRATGAWRRPDGWTLAMQSASAPQVVWLVHFADPVGGDPAMPRAFIAVGVGYSPRESAQ